MIIKNLFTKFEELEAITESIDIEENEEAWDKAYTEEFNAHKALAEEIMKLINCDRGTANKMIATKRNELRNLIERIA